MLNLTPTVIERLWEHAKQVDSCWEWTSRRDRQGYGRLGIQGASLRAHRIAWIATHGPIPTGLCVLHHCDNPPCINPAHLFLGTPKDNVHDRIAKGRHGSSGRPIKFPGSKGVYWNKRDQRWMATIMVGPRSQNIGYFKTLSEGIEARNRALAAE